MFRDIESAQWPRPLREAPALLANPEQFGCVVPNETTVVSTSVLFPYHPITQADMWGEVWSLDRASNTLTSPLLRAPFPAGEPEAHDFDDQDRRYVAEILKPNTVVHNLKNIVFENKPGYKVLAVMSEQQEGDFYRRRWSLQRPEPVSYVLKKKGDNGSFYRHREPPERIVRTAYHPGNEWTYAWAKYGTGVEHLAAPFVDLAGGSATWRGAT